MNRERPDITRRVKDQKAAGHNAVFKAVLIYENFATGVRARRFFEALARASDKVLEEQMWDFEVRGIREARNAAAGAAPQGRRSGRFHIRPNAMGVVRQINIPGPSNTADVFLRLPSGELVGLVGAFYQCANSIRSELSAVSVCI